MRRTARINNPRQLLLGATVVLLALALPASGGVGLDSNLAAAFGHLNFAEADVQHVIDNTWDVQDPALFNFAASLDPPSIDPASEPWAVPARIGVTWATWSDASSFPQFPAEIGEVNGSLFIPHGGPQTGTEYALMWAQMSGPIPVMEPMSLFQNWSFPFAVPGQPTWAPNSAFPQDTWGNASIIPFVTYGPSPWELGLSEVQSDGSLASKDFEGFALISGDTIILGIDRDALLSNGASGLTYGFAGHIHDGGFGATPESMSLVSFATGTPGSLISIPPPTLLDIGQMAPPTTTTLQATTTTLIAETTTTVVDSTSPGESETENSETGGISVLAVILGLIGVVVVVIGGRLFFAKADDPCVELLKAWQGAQKACEDAEGDADRAKEDCDEAEQERMDLEQQINDICKKWPPACEEEGGSAERSGEPESRVTSRDLHAKSIALGRLWDDYRSGSVTAQEVEEAWEQMDTPKFREELRRETDRKIAERSQLEKDLKAAKKKAHDKCADAQKAAEAAEAACDKAEAAKKAYEECLEEQNAEAFVDAFMGLGSEAGSNEGTTPSVAVSSESATGTSPPSIAPQRKVGIPVPIALDTEGLSGDQATRSRKLERIFTNRRGTGDIAAVALDLYQFNTWHTQTFGEPWFTWSTGERNPNSPTSTAATSERFMQTRVMACYEFVHFAAFIASDQLGRQRVGGEDEDNPIFLDEYSVDWGFEDEININTQPIGDGAPRGSVVTGSFRWGDYDNSAGYYHTGISIGDGKVISLGSDGLILEDATGRLGGCFPSAGYTNIEYGDYAYGKNNPAPGQ